MIINLLNGDIENSNYTLVVSYISSFKVNNMSLFSWYKNNSVNNSLTDEQAITPSNSKIWPIAKVDGITSIKIAVGSVPSVTIHNNDLKNNLADIKKV